LITNIADLALNSDADDNPWYTIHADWLLAAFGRSMPSPEKDIVFLLLRDDV
jgi:hypothetical protein